MAKAVIPTEIRAEIKAAFEHGPATRSATIEKYRGVYSKDAIYRAAYDEGWTSGRRPRRDRGASKRFSQEDLELVARVKKAGARPQLRKQLITTEQALAQLAANGHCQFEGASASTVDRLLRKAGLGERARKHPKEHVTMRSLHPNHVWQLDASIAVQWRIGPGGKRLARRDEFTLHKPEKWKEEREILLRWLVVDHYSGAMFVRYVLAPGENAKDLLSFLIEAMQPKPDAQRFPFCGVPAMLMLDRGAAGQSKIFQRFLKAIGIEALTHNPGSPQAKGAVEVSHNIWERFFEWQLLLKPASTLEELNERAMVACTVLNATQIHSRHGRTRSAMWRSITADQFRHAPPAEHCFAVASTAPHSRVVDKFRRITFGGQEWQITSPVTRNEKVRVELNPWAPDDLIVTTAEGERLACERIILEQAGFRFDAPIIGHEHARHAATPAEKLEKAAATLPPPIEPKSRIETVPAVAYLPLPGTPLDMSELLPKQPPIPADNVPRRLREALGLARITEEQRELIDELLDGREQVEEVDFYELRERFRVALIESQRASGRAKVA
ncbi:MAG: DDE-type integrase/transposase/recombinase [Betaproteobacteria bacterium]|nr:DDE-type integrase/transposase/recombinase [Betaproteobacteria bacterium]